MTKTDKMVAIAPSAKRTYKTNLMAMTESDPIFVVGNIIILLIELKKYHFRLLSNNRRRRKEGV